MSGKRRILSIDGGGLKGVIPAAFLATMEEITGKRVVDHMDLIAGTSTGGIIALGLGLGMSAAEVLNFYETKGPGIFGQNAEESLSIVARIKRWYRDRRGRVRRAFVPKYDSDNLRKALEGAFGHRSLGESRTRLVVPSFDRQRRDIHVFKTAHHERCRVDFKERAVDVAMATGAAPSYLPGHRLHNGVSLLDGGVWANNPVGVAVVEAIGVLGWKPEDLEVLSIGCSEAPSVIPESAGMIGLALKMADVFMVGQSRGAVGTAKVLMGDGHERRRLFRYQHVASLGEFELDGASGIPALRGIGSNLAREACPTLEPVFFDNPCEPFVPLRGPGAS